MKKLFNCRKRIGLSLLLVISLLVLSVSSVFALIENFTTYTEVDTGGFLTVAADNITATNMTSVTEAYVYRDYGANAFDAISANFTLYAYSSNATYKYGYGGIAFANVLNDTSAFGVNDITMGAQSWDAFQVAIRLFRGAQVELDSFVTTANTTYYCNLSRAAGNATVTGRVYSDAAHTVLLDTLTITLPTAATKWRYAYGMVNFANGAVNRWIDCSIANLDYSLPSVTTNAATEVTSISFLASGSITDIGTGSNSTEIVVEWGTTSGVYTDNNTTVGNYGVVAFSITADNLTPATTYYYRVGAESNISGGWGYGAEMSVTTLGLVTELRGVPTSDSFILTWIKGSESTNTTVAYSTTSHPTTANFTYTEVDTGGFLAVAADNITITAMTSQTDAYVYRDYGTNAFDTISANFTIWGAGDAAAAGRANIAFSNVVNDITGFGANDIFMGGEIEGAALFKIRLGRGDFAAFDSLETIPSNTTYYCNLSRATGSATVTGRIYSNATHTTLLDTLTITLTDATTKWRYAYDVVNYNNGVPARLYTGWIGNVDYTAPVTIAYHGSGYQATIENLTPGQAYYFTVWSYDNATSTSNTYLVLSTLGVDVPTGAAVAPTSISGIDTPILPTNIAQTASVPPGSNLEPFTTIFNFFTSGNLTSTDNQTAGGGLGMPIGNVWESLTMAGIVMLGMATYIKLKNFFITYAVVFVLVCVAVGLDLAQGFLPPVLIIIGLGVWAIDKYYQ